MDWQVLRETLRAVRAGRGPSLRRIHQKTGIAPSTIHRIENTKKYPGHRPDMDTVLKLVEAFEPPMALSEFFQQLEKQPPTGDAGLTARERAADVPGSVLDVLRTEHPDWMGGAWASAKLTRQDAEFLARLSDACLRAAAASMRLDIRALFEDLATGFAGAAYPMLDAQEATTEAVRLTRKRPGGRTRRTR